MSVTRWPTIVVRHAVALLVFGLLSVAPVEASVLETTRCLTQADAGSTVELQVGDELTVALPGNPTTGFQWMVGRGNPAILLQTGDPEFVAETDAIGSGGCVILSFKAVGKGDVPLMLVYRRPFERDVPPVRTFEVTVTVR